MIRPQNMGTLMIVMCKSLLHQGLQTLLCKHGAS
eukprot:CAMPEP_0119116430 /NCGR_PEP_ID=MMETSP1180-20130426/52280_1 /TAXON_ID=3052 ORGANISM="Chlamydomonas cf sp, Strain CCMP681" /NCGR_SAMPLE_ID=MMETSP1180 /ASSEMBLY_ACC=CAM_ASM_000741 /LENGTH=33 /DNA_ID= /DNA_START= /DNA_END= /DNA_ORIENTATION=